MLKQMDHKRYPRQLRKKTNEQILFILRDAKETAELQKDFNPNVGYYLDEVHYCAMELLRRKATGS